MSNGNKDWKLVQGCLSPKLAANKDWYKRIVNIFSPVLYFDPDETFFPVDLPSAVAASGLYKVSGKPYKEKAVLVPPKTPPTLKSSDLASVDSNHFTTVSKWKETKRKVGDPPEELTMPIPKLGDVYTKYTSKKIPAKLTMYATVCELKDVPNYQFLEKYHPVIGLGKLADGLLISYYFYFPGGYCAEYDREGDWSGISILFGMKPSGDPKKLEVQFKNKMPVWVSYFRKVNNYHISYDVGIRSWSKVSRVKDDSGLVTHPKVYISLGRHNCYFEPINTKISEAPHWTPIPDPKKIEEGDYSPSPTGNTDNILYGGDDFDDPWWIYVLFPHMLLFDMCGIGCEFDSSGLPPSYQDSNDSVRSGGVEASPDKAKTGKTPSSDNYPAKKPTPKSPINLKLNVVYVDTDDQSMKEMWKYKGSWGAAEVTKYSGNQWGKFKGFERPNLSSWFLWNLFWDVTFGSKGGSGFYYSKGP